MLILSVQTSGNFSLLGFSKLTSKSRKVEDILKASYKPKDDGKSIFFIETKKHENKVLTLSPRQACSVESAGNFLRFLRPIESKILLKTRSNEQS